MTPSKRRARTCPVRKTTIWLTESASTSSATQLVGLIWSTSTRILSSDFLFNHVSESDSVGSVESDPTDPTKKIKWSNFMLFWWAECSCHWYSLNLECSVVDRYADPVPFWCRSRPGSGLASTRSRSTCGSCPKFYTCWKIGGKI